MGLLLVQWARHLGAQVIGTVSTEEKAKAARQAGVTDVIRYTEQEFVAETKRLTNGHGADLIIDGVGKTIFRKSGSGGVARSHHDFRRFQRCGRPNRAEFAHVSGGSLQNYLMSQEELMSRANDVIEGMRTAG
jgi:NADPH:quinone reductase